MLIVPVLDYNSFALSPAAMKRTHKKAAKAAFLCVLLVLILLYA